MSEYSTPLPSETTALPSDTTSLSYRKSWAGSRLAFPRPPRHTTTPPSEVRQHSCGCTPPTTPSALGPPPLQGTSDCCFSDNQEESHIVADWDNGQAPPFNEISQSRRRMPCEWDCSTGPPDEAGGARADAATPPHQLRSSGGLPLLSPHTAASVSTDTDSLDLSPEFGMFAPRRPTFIETERLQHAMMVERRSRAPAVMAAAFGPAAIVSALLKKGSDTPEWRTSSASANCCCFPSGWSPAHPNWKEVFEEQQLSATTPGRGSRRRVNGARERKTLMRGGDVCGTRHVGLLGEIVPVPVRFAVNEGATRLGSIELEAIQVLRVDFVLHPEERERLGAAVRV